MESGSPDVRIGLGPGPRRRPQARRERLRSKMQPIFSVFLLASTFTAAPQAEEGPSQPGGIVALVSDEVITQAELDREVEKRMARFNARVGPSVLGRELETIQRLALDDLIENRILVQLVAREEKKLGKPLAVDADVDAEVQQQVKILREKGYPVSTPEDVYRLTLENEKLTREEYRKIIRNRVGVSRFLWLKVFSASDAVVSPEEAKAYYRAHRREFSTPLEISFRQIIIPPTRNNTMDLLIELVENGIRDKEDFVQIARKVQDVLGRDPEDADRVLTRGFTELKEWLPPISDVLRELGVGQISQRVVTAQDIRYFKVEEVKDGTALTFEEAHDEIQKRIRDEKNRIRLEEFLARQRQKTSIVDFLPRTVETRQP